MTIEQAFGAVVRRLRKERLFSQEGLSEISSLDRVFISRLERGLQQPKLITIFQLATALHVSVAQIFTEVELLLRLNNSSVCKNSFDKIDFNIFWKHFRGKPMNSDPGLKGNETILLVEDEDHLRDFLFHALTAQGYKVIVAEDGQDAVNNYIEFMNDIDMVLMDVMMPRKDGIAAYKEIRKLNSKANIILMSGYSSVSLGGLDHLNFIQKPMLPTQLFSNIRQLLDCKAEIVTA